MTDFVGFTYNNVHSSSLGIVRTSDGSRFNENLLPTIQDKTVQVPGGDGTYYFGSYYTQRQFNVSFAFDSLTETQFRNLRTFFGDKKIHPLIFDEMPYKEYQAKVTGSATIKHICFNEGNQRVYKGEGSVQFTAYYPFARSTFKFLKNCNMKNKNEWSDSSGMRINGWYDETNSESGELDQFISNINGFYVYNPGDVKTDFILKLKFKSKKIPEGSIYLDEGGQGLEFSEISCLNNDYGIQINTKLNLVEGIDSSGNRTGNLYNDCITSGFFFKIPNIRGQKEVQTLHIDLASAEQYEPEIIYDYYYF